MKQRVYIQNIAVGNLESGSVWQDQLENLISPLKSLFNRIAMYNRPNLGARMLFFASVNMAISYIVILFVFGNNETNTYFKFPLANIPLFYGILTCLCFVTI